MSVVAPKKRKLAQLSKKERGAYTKLIDDVHESISQLIHRELTSRIIELQDLLQEAQAIPMLANQSVNRSTNYSTNQSNDQSDSQSVNQSNDQSTNQSANQQTNQSTDQSINQPPVPLKNDWFNDPPISQTDNEAYLLNRQFDTKTIDSSGRLVDSSGRLTDYAYDWRPKRRVTYISYRPDLPIINQLHKRLQPIIRRLVEIFTDMALSVKLILPDVGETSNLAVDVPVEAYTTIQLQLRFLRPQLTSHILYHSHRGSLHAKTVKYPNNVDYAESIRQWDEREWSRTVNLIRETRSRCMGAYDSLKKNEEKLREARVKEHHHAMM